MCRGIIKNTYFKSYILTYEKNYLICLKLEIYIVMRIYT